MSSTQGVVIPQQNVQNLMLRQEVVDAVQKGKFHIYPIATIDQGVEILTGVRAGTRNPDGTFEDGTVHRLADEELQRLARTLKESGLDKES